MQPRKGWVIVSGPGFRRPGFRRSGTGSADAREVQVMKKKYMDEEVDEDEDEDDDDVPQKAPSDASFAPPVSRMCVFPPSCV